MLANTTSLPRLLPLSTLDKSIEWSYLEFSYALTFLIGYAFICKLLRYRRMHQIERGYYHGTKSGESISKPLSQMTEDEAHKILMSVSELEFPTMYEKGLQLALFRTYGIPSISELLTRTTQLTASSTVGKRYADTTVLIAEMYGNSPSSARGIEAFARLNYLHGHYIKNGKITNDDMLYTLALFMNHPVKVINRYEWRKWTEVERCATGLFHLGMARAMEIDLSVLPSSQKGWRDGVQFYDELDTWAETYEERVMIPTQKNWETAVQTKNLLLITVPGFLHGVAGKLVSSAMDERLRLAVMFEEPGWVMPQLLEGFISLRRWGLRHLALPRPESLRSRLVHDESDGQKRRHFSRYDMMPHYIKPTLWNRYGPSAWPRRMMGLPLPGDKGMLPEGFLTQDVGPDIFKGKGAREAEDWKQRLRVERTGRCPFGISG